jgi:hypothetical protein
VHVELERYGRIAEFVDAVHRFEPAGHPDLDDSLPERADVGDDVHVAGSHVRLPVEDALQGGLDLIERGAGGGDLLGRGSGCFELGEHGPAVGGFLLQPFLLTLEFGHRLAFLTEPFTFLAGPFLLFSDHREVVGSQFQFGDPQPVVGVGDLDRHGLAESGDGLA